MYLSLLAKPLAEQLAIIFPADQAGMDRSFIYSAPVRIRYPTAYHRSDGRQRHCENYEHRFAYRQEPDHREIGNEESVLELHACDALGLGKTLPLLSNQPAIA